MNGLRPHREVLPARRCGCGAWLSTGNPLDICAPCNGGTWQPEVAPADVWGQLAAVPGRNRVEAADAMAEIMEAT